MLNRLLPYKSPLARLLIKNAEAAAAAAAAHKRHYAIHTISIQQPATASIRTSRRKRALIYALAALTTGYMLGTLTANTIDPAPFPEPDTPADEILLADLSTRIDNLSRTKLLRGRKEARQKPSSADDESQQHAQEQRCIELSANDMAALRRPSALQGSMRGARGVGVERTFWKPEDGELVVVVSLGPGLCGWPGVVHGGAIATVLSDKARLALALMAGRDEFVQTRSEIGYKRPTRAGDFYVVRVKQAATAESRITVDAVLETVDGKVCAQSSMSFDRSRLQSQS